MKSLNHLYLFKLINENLFARIQLNYLRHLVIKLKSKKLLNQLFN